MKRLFNILILCAVYILFCGKSCTDESVRTSWEEDQVIAVKDSIRGEFESDFLNEEARYTAEMNAVSKLKDLADYVNIYADKSLDSNFRTKAGEMIREIFISEDARLSFGEFKKGTMKESKLGEFIKTGFGKDILSVKFSIDSIRILNPISRSGDENYKGKLYCIQKVTGASPTDTIDLPPVGIAVDFSAIRKNKVFGNDTIKAWTVSLGDMD